jgi:hypothetical protein
METALKQPIFTDIVEVEPKAAAMVVAPSSDGASLMRMVEVAMSRPDADIEKLAGLLAIKERWDATEAKKAYHAAMSEFKRNPPTILKDKRVSFQTNKGLTEYDHATIGNVVRQIIAALAVHDLSHSWSTEQLEGGQVAVTCTITHKLGHSESVTLKAGRDESGGKNSIQALGSAITYLQRYTVLAITGLAVEDGSDDDGRGGATSVLDEWIYKANSTKTLDELREVRKDGLAAFIAVHDVDGGNSFKAACADRKAMFVGATK